jgi:hypothetical protein
MCHLDQLGVRWGCLSLALIVLGHIGFDAASQPPVWRDSSLTNNLRRLFVISHADEGAMPQVPGIRPLDESDLADEASV